MILAILLMVMADYMVIEVARMSYCLCVQPHS